MTVDTLTHHCAEPGTWKPSCCPNTYGNDCVSGLTCRVPGASKPSVVNHVVVNRYKEAGGGLNGTKPSTSVWWSVNDSVDDTSWDLWIPRTITLRCCFCYFASCESKNIWWAIKGELHSEKNVCCAGWRQWPCAGEFSQTVTDLRNSSFIFTQTLREELIAAQCVTPAAISVEQQHPASPLSGLRHVVVETDGARWLVRWSQVGWWEVRLCRLNNEPSSTSTRYVGRSCCGVTDHVRLLQDHQRHESQRRRRTGESRKRGEEEERRGATDNWWMCES